MMLVKRVYTLIAYCRFKHSFEIEQYLDFITDRRFKNSIN